MGCEISGAPTSRQRGVYTCAGAAGQTLSSDACAFAIVPGDVRKQNFGRFQARLVVFGHEYTGLMTAYDAENTNFP